VNGLHDVETTLSTTIAKLRHFNWANTPAILVV